MEPQPTLTHQNHATVPVPHGNGAATHQHSTGVEALPHSHGVENGGNSVNVPEALKPHLTGLEVKPMVSVDVNSVPGDVPLGYNALSGLHSAEEYVSSSQFGAQPPYGLTGSSEEIHHHKQKKHKEDKELSQKRRKQKEEKRVVKAFIKVATMSTVPIPVKGMPGEPQTVSVKLPDGSPDSIEWTKQQTLRPLDKQQLYNLFEKHIRLKDVASSVFWKYVLNSVYKNKQMFKTTRPNGLRCLTGVQFRSNLHEEKVREELKPYIEKMEKYLSFGVEHLLNDIESLAKSPPEKPKHGNTGKKKRKKSDGLDKSDDDVRKDKKKGLIGSSDSIATPLEETVLTGDQSSAITSIFEVMQLLSNPNIARAMKILAAGGDLSEADKELAMSGISAEEMIGLEKLMNLQMLLQQQHQLMPLLQQLQQLQLQQLQQQQQLVEQQQAMAAEQHPHDTATTTTTTTATTGPSENGGEAAVEVHH